MNDSVYVKFFASLETDQQLEILEIVGQLYRNELASEWAGEALDISEVVLSDLVYTVRNFLENLPDNLNETFWDYLPEE